MSEPTFTHYGWFSFCPVKIAGIDTEEPTVAARWPILDPLLTAAEWVQGVRITFCSLVNPHYEPGFKIHISGEIKEVA